MHDLIRNTGVTASLPIENSGNVRKRVVSASTNPINEGTPRRCSQAPIRINPAATTRAARTTFVCAENAIAIPPEGLRDFLPYGRKAQGACKPGTRITLAHDNDLGELDLQEESYDFKLKFGRMVRNKFEVIGLSNGKRLAGRTHG